MVSYRFCRPDDLLLIAEALNQCYLPHFPGEPAIDLTRLKTEAQEVNLWASSCMIAMAGDNPVAVVTGAKREGVTWVQRIGVKPGYQGKGHGSHLVTSLGAKLAILGPPLLTVELDTNLTAANRFFRKLGYQPVAVLADFRHEGGLEPLAPTPAIQPIPVSELFGADEFWRRDAPAWERANETLRNRAGQLRALAVVSEVRIESALVYRPIPEGGGAEIWRFLTTPGERQPLYLTLMLRALVREAGSVLAVPRLGQDEAPFALLESLGFRRTGEYTRHDINAGDERGV